MQEYWFGAGGKSRVFKFKSPKRNSLWGIGDTDSRRFIAVGKKVRVSNQERLDGGQQNP